MKKKQARKNDLKLICVFFLAGLVIFLSNEAMAFSLRLNGESSLDAMADTKNTTVIKNGNRIGIDAVLYEGSTIELYLGGAFADGMVIRGDVPGGSDTVDIKSKRKEALLGLRIKFFKIERMNLYIPLEFIYVKGNYEATLSNPARTSLIDDPASGDFSIPGLRTGLGLDYGLGSNWTIGTALTLGFYPGHGITIRNSNTDQRAEISVNPSTLINFGIGVKYSF